MDIIKRIERLCEERNWTYYELAKQSGLSANAIYNLNKKGTIPTLPNLEKMCEAFDITIEQFFCGYKAPELSDEAKNVLSTWESLSNIEKATINNLIHSFRLIKNS